MLAHVAAKRRKRRTMERRRSRRSVVVTVLVTIGVIMLAVQGVKITLEGAPTASTRMTAATTRRSSR